MQRYNEKLNHQSFLSVFLKENHIIIDKNQVIVCEHTLIVHENSSPLPA